MSERLMLFIEPIITVNAFVGKFWREFLQECWLRESIRRRR